MSLIHAQSKVNRRFFWPVTSDHNMICDEGRFMQELVILYLTDRAGLPILWIVSLTLVFPEFWEFLEFDVTGLTLVLMGRHMTTKPVPSAGKDVTTWSNKLSHLVNGLGSQCRFGYLIKIYFGLIWLVSTDCEWNLLTEVTYLNSMRLAN